MPKMTMYGVDLGSRPSETGLTYYPCRKCGVKFYRVQHGRRIACLACGRPRNLSKSLYKLLLRPAE
jgi:DNA-directed RNA polymerase subunit RPC12/RpoP